MKNVSRGMTLTGIRDFRNTVILERWLSEGHGRAVEISFDEYEKRFTFEAREGFRVLYRSKSRDSLGDAIAQSTSAIALDCDYDLSDLR